MHLKTILNRVQKHSSFVYGTIRLIEAKTPELEFEILSRKGSRGRCSGCERRGRTYDHLPPRRYQFVPLWGILVFFIYSKRRIDCERCGVTAEIVPWAEGKSPITTTYAWFLSKWAKRLSWQATAEAFGTSWDTVYRAVRLAVAWGLAHRDLEGITSIGVDEVLWHRGYKFLTVVYQIDGHCRRLLWVGQDRKTETLESFFDFFGERATRLRYVCSDMWKPYLDVLHRRASGALHILDRYHIISNQNKSLDEVRAEEARRQKRDGYDPVLKHSRWLLLKNPDSLTGREETKLSDLLRYNLKSVRSYLLKEEFQQLWDYKSPAWAGKFLDEWCRKVMRSRIEPMKKIARSMRGHRKLILNWFEAKGAISAGPVEGLNNKLKVTFRRAYGIRTFPATETALYHSLGKLPTPKHAHEFF
jgi:transposase